MAKRIGFINKCNKTLAHLRQITSDIMFSPFKGNMRNGCRRRRLDFKTCRAIIEKVYIECINSKKEGLEIEQLSIF